MDTCSSPRRTRTTLTSYLLLTTLAALPLLPRGAVDVCCNRQSIPLAPPFAHSQAAGTLVQTLLLPLVPIREGAQPQPATVAAAAVPVAGSGREEGDETP